MRGKKKRLRQDSRGFTLIELMLTIAILGIISIPLFSYFTEAAKHNAQSRVKQNASVAAQDVLEEFKNSSYSLDDYGVVCSADPDWTVKSMPDADGKYTVSKTMTIDRSTFTVDAQVMPLKGVATAGGVMAIDYQRSVIGTMDTGKDVLASDSGLAYTSARLFFGGKYTDECMKQTPAVVPNSAVSDSIASNLTCTIEIQADAAGANREDDVVVRVDYVYCYAGATGNGITPDNIDLSSFEYRKNIVSSSIEAKELNNIYIFYEPLELGETITFKSDTDFSSAVEDDQLKLFIIAQSSVPAGEPEPTGYVQRSSTYQLKIVSTINGANTGNSFYNKIKTVYTNLSLDTNEVAQNGDMLVGKLKKDVNGNEYTIVDTESMNRVAEIEVAIYKDAKEYARVTGSKVQN